MCYSHSNKKDEKKRVKLPACFCRMFIKLLIAVTIALAAAQALAGDLRVAAASNFSGAIKVIANRFEVATGHRVILIFGSTGKHYAQIRHGAPFDVFFAADSLIPERLEREGLAVPGSRFTYAFGKLVLWSLQPGYVDPDGKVLQHGDFRHLALANPRLAPYGVAAREVLQASGLWNEFDKRFVRGENIGQAYQFVRSGNAELGFVARSQVIYMDKMEEGSLWDVPQALYTPIEQQAVLLNDKEAARAFMSFVRDEGSIKIIRNHGYETP
jgi:molybdate transport system substrate-binding protein